MPHTPEEILKFFEGYNLLHSCTRILNGKECLACVVDPCIDRRTPEEKRITKMLAEAAAKQVCNYYEEDDEDANLHPRQKRRKTLASILNANNTGTSKPKKRKKS